MRRSGPDSLLSTSNHPISQAALADRWSYIAQQFYPFPSQTR